MLRREEIKGGGGVEGEDGWKVCGMVRLGYVVRVCMCGGGQKGIVIGGQVGLWSVCDMDMRWVGVGGMR